MANSSTTKFNATLPDTDFEVRSLDAMCINESELSHPLWYNLKYTVVGVLLALFLSRPKSYPGTGYRKCSA